jgi:hypothetical protein
MDVDSDEKEPLEEQAPMVAAFGRTQDGCRCDQCRWREASIAWDGRALCEVCYPIEVSFKRMEQIAAHIHGHDQQEN